MHAKKGMHYGITLFISYVSIGCTALEIWNKVMGRDDSIKYKLLNSTADDLILLFTGDTQYFFLCVETNRGCKDASEPTRRKYGLNFYCDMSKSDAEKKKIPEFRRKKYVKECVRRESTYANTIQRDVMAELVNSMNSKPTALIINGDLTSYGHHAELRAFKDDWEKFPAKMLPGLGNHDYENNVNDCVSNHCANRMLFWLTRYADRSGIKLDYRKSVEFLIKTSYIGSFAYSVILCSESGRTCARVLQLHNRLNYATQIEAPLTQWSITSSLQFLRKELNSMKDLSMPLFINLHNMDAFSRKTIKDLLKPMIAADAVLTNLRVFVLYAHFHRRHDVSNECIGRSIPFVHVGSVPNNRFTAVKISGNSIEPPEIFLMSSNANRSATIVGYVQPAYTTCIEPLIA